jgi:CHAD domain-containing protein
MGRNSKWIKGRSGDATQRIARRALAARLERTWHYLERSVCEPPSETENVHQLRVFARRTAAALEIFDAWLPVRRGGWMRKQLKRIRKTAGEARDLDVLALGWRQRDGQSPSAQTVLLLEQVERCRRAAQRPIEEVFTKLCDKDFARRTYRFLRHVRARGGEQGDCERFGSMARLELGRLVAPYLAAARAEMNDAHALHGFRIQGKQVRYAMEVFAGAFDAPFREELYPSVADLQDRLGAINDHVTAQAYLVAWREEADSCAARSALEASIEHERQSFESSRREFLAWWTAERQDDLRRRFARYVELDTAG